VSSSSIWGGGFANEILKWTGVTDGFIVAGDIWGAATTTNKGTNWTPKNAGMRTDNARSIADLGWVGSDLWAAYGTGGTTDNGIMVSTGGTGDWQVKNLTVGGSLLRFEGNNPDGVDYPGGWKHPRPTGKLMVSEGSNVFIGTYAVANTPTHPEYESQNQGLVRTTPTGTNGTSIALAAGSTECPSGCTITSIVRDPNAANPTLYVGTHGHGLFRVRDLTCSGTNCATVVRVDYGGLTSFPDPLADVADLVIVDGELWCACGLEGVRRSAVPTTALTGKSGGILFRDASGDLTQDDNIREYGDTQVTAIDAIPKTNKAAKKVYIGVASPFCENLVGIGRRCHTIYRLNDNNGATFNDIVFSAGTGTTISANVGGTTTKWWATYYNPFNSLNGTSYAASALRVNSGTIYVAGRSGVWRTTGTDTSWEPAVKNLTGTTNNSVASVPTNLGKFYVGNTDYQSLTEDTVIGTPPNPPVIQGNGITSSVVFSVVADPLHDNTAYAAAGDRSDNDNDCSVQGGTNCLGGVYVTTDGGVNFTRIFGNPPTDHRFIGVGLSHRSNGSSVVYAAQAGGAGGTTGFWRYESGTATQVGTPLMFSSTDQAQTFASISVPSTSSPYVYAFDRQTGTLWRSADYGDTWKDVFDTAQQFGHVGYVAADPATPTTAYLSVKNDVYKLTNCDQASCTQQLLPDPQMNGANAAEGPIAFKDGTSTLYMATRVTGLTDNTPTTTPGLYQWSGTAWTLLTSGKVEYANSAGYPRGLAVGSDGTAYLTTTGQGTRIITKI
jgi:hypothetical protein